MYGHGLWVEVTCLRTKNMLVIKNQEKSLDKRNALCYYVVG